MDGNNLSEASHGEEPVWSKADRYPVRSGTTGYRPVPSRAVQVLLRDAAGAVAANVVKQIGSPDRPNLHVGPLPVLALIGFDIDADGRCRIEP